MHGTLFPQMEQRITVPSENGTLALSCLHFAQLLSALKSTINSFVLVGNIAYEATEEELKEIFSKVGPVVNFRYVSIA